MGVEKEITIPKAQSKYSNYNSTPKWEATDKVILLETKNGGKSIIDELPGGTKQKVAQLEQQIQNNKLQSTKVANPISMISSVSEISISSSQSSEENLVRQKPKKSRIPVRSNSNVSLSSNNSTLSHSDLFQSSKRKKNGKNVLLEPKVYEINEKTREALLSVDHPFLKSISKNKIYEAISFHKNDRVRVKNLEDEDLAELRNSKRQVMIFSR